MARRVGVESPQNEDEMTQADIHSIIVRISTNAADQVAISRWEELEPAIDGKINMKPQPTVRWSRHHDDAVVNSRSRG
jgi:hypothetical protein